MLTDFPDVVLVFLGCDSLCVHDGINSRVYLNSSAFVLLGLCVKKKESLSLLLKTLLGVSLAVVWGVGLAIAWQLLLFCTVESHT